jgi:hypothetical protein
MEIIKRKILLEDIISRTSDGTHGTIVGDAFYIKVMLVQNIDDMGIFNNFDNTEFPLTGGTLYDLSVSGETGIRYVNDVVTDYLTPTKKLSGTTEERLEDVRNYDEDNIYRPNFDIRRENYTNYTGASVNGRTRVTVDSDPIEYVIDANDDGNIGTLNQNDGFYFKTFSGTNRTEIYYNRQGWNETNVGHSGLTKEEYLFGITSEPQVFSDIFIDRGITSPKETHLKLSEIRTIDELTRYGNGFFNIKRG